MEILRRHTLKLIGKYSIHNTILLFHQKKDFILKNDYYFLFLNSEIDTNNEMIIPQNPSY